MKDQRKNNGTYFLLSSSLILFGIGVYPKIWEYRQPKETITNAVLREISPYNRYSEVSLPSRGNVIYVVGDTRAIDFSSERFDKKVQKGDSINLVVRRKFFGKELEGLSITPLK